MDLNTTFLKGRMNKSLDERVLPDGEYIDALNIRIGSTENNSVGAIENSLGNTKITSILYEGDPLSTNAKCIGAYEDSQHETIYWFVTDPGNVDMVLSYNERTSTLIYHVISTTVLNFDTQYLVNGIDLIDGLLFWTDNLNPPRRININGSYAYPTMGVDNITEDDISVIVAPPLESPDLQLIVLGGEENYMTDKFISFSYRYKYKDGEYSALSQFSDIAFEPENFRIDYTFYGNGAMQNLFNSVNISFNTGNKNVTEIDICFKLSDSSIVNIIERYIKEEQGWGDDQIQSIQFNNKKIYTALSSSELTRLFDNVPLTAKSQTTMGNRLMYGNYVDGYDIDTVIDYDVVGVSEDINISEIIVSTLEGVEYNINPLTPVTYLGSKIKLDFTGLDIKENSILNIDFAIIHKEFGGSTLYDDTVNDCPAPQNNYNYSYSFSIQQDFSNAYQLSINTGFINSIYTSVALPGCDGFSVTDDFNCNTATKDVICDPINGGWDKLGSGINTIGQGFTITSSPAEPNYIYIQFPAIKFEGYNDDTSAYEYAYEYFSESNTVASITKINSRKSLHSNRDFEVGIVYQDEYLRSSTALVSKDNTVFFPASTSDKKNYIVSTINNLPPSWAKRYKFVVKPSKSKYETIYTSLFFPDTTGFTWFKLEGENISKARVGETLIVKMDTEGYVGSLVTTEVLEVKAQSNNFITIDSGNQDVVHEPAGTYMRLKASNFQAEYNQNSFIEASVLKKGNNYRHAAVALFEKNPAFIETSPNSSVNRRYIPYAIPAGSIITIKFRIKRNKAGLDAGCGSYSYLYEKTIVANADYSDFYEFAIAQNVQLDTGIQGGGDELAGITDTQQTNSFDFFVNQTGSSGNPSRPVYPFLEPVQTALNLVGFCKTEEDGEWDGSMYLVTASGIPGCSGKSAYNTTNVTLQLANGTLVFETDALDADGEIYFEGSDSFPIVNGYHMSGDADADQNQTSSLPAVVTLNFFDCFSFGNGVESYKINDALTGDPFYLGERVTAVAQEQYRKADRYASMTYSGIYNAETNINKLNEFNLSLANFKDLEKSFGPINRLYARRTDVLVLQEDKISYILAGKNLLSDSAGGGQIASIPEVLGTQIARIEDYGISNNPESFSVFGGEVYFTDIKRNSVLNLRGGSSQSDALSVVSDMGMKYWFRDEFKNSQNYFKIGGYDPYMDEYVLHLTETAMPTELDVYGCGITISKQNVNGVYEFDVELGNEIGEVTVSLTLFDGEVDIVVEYDGGVIEEDSLTEPGEWTFTFQKTEVFPNTIRVTITSTDASYSTITSCVNIIDYLTVYRVVYNNPSSENQTIHNSYGWSLSGYSSPLLGDFITMQADGVSLYESQFGGLSQGMIPADESDIRLVSKKIEGDTFVFNPALNSFKYLISNNLYTAEELLPLLTTITPITGEYRATINDAALAGFDYLYLVWDYRSMLEIDLCYHESNPFSLCCGACSTSSYYIDSDSFDTATSIWLDENQTELAIDGLYLLDGTYRQLLSGVLLDPVPCPGCVVQSKCFEGVWEEGDPAHPDGGSITYVNADAYTITQDLIWLGDLVVIDYLEIISYTGVVEIDCGSIELTEGLRSDGFESSDICGEAIENTVFIYGNDGCEILIGNLACNTNNILDTFEGGNLYYTIYLLLCDTDLYTYVCKIDNDGVITEIENCPAPPP
jgi:hypothetical protein